MPTPWNRAVPVGVETSGERASARTRRNGDSTRASGDASADIWLRAIRPRAAGRGLILCSSTETAIDRALLGIEAEPVMVQNFDIDRDSRPAGSPGTFNFYGPPGTGKTSAAHLIAMRLGMLLLDVPYSSLEDSLVGKTEKNIVASFHAARDQHAVLFFDEADSILGRRLACVQTGSDEHVNRTRSVMLRELQDNEDVVVVFASNRARAYDPAFRRRIRHHIEFPLPDRETRVRLASFLLATRVPREPAASPQWLADETEGLSHAEIKAQVNWPALLDWFTRWRAQGGGVLLEQSDFLTAIRDVRRAREQVAVNEPPSTRVEEKILSPDETPADIRAAAECARAAGDLPIAPGEDRSPARPARWDEPGPRDDGPSA